MSKIREPMNSPIWLSSAGGNQIRNPRGHSVALAHEYRKLFDVIHVTSPIERQHSGQ